MITVLGNPNESGVDPSILLPESSKSAQVSEVATRQLSSENNRSASLTGNLIALLPLPLATLMLKIFALLGGAFTRTNRVVKPQEVVKPRELVARPKLSDKLRSLQNEINNPELMSEELSKALSVISEGIRKPMKALMDDPSIKNESLFEALGMGAISEQTRKHMNEIIDDVCMELVHVETREKRYSPDTSSLGGLLRSKLVPITGSPEEQNLLTLIRELITKHYP